MSERTEKNMDRPAPSTPMTTKSLLQTALLAALLGACAHSGMGPGARADIQARMGEAQPPIAQCYAASLKSNRRLKGMLMIDFTAEAKTGQFKNIRFGRDEVNDTPIRQCILAEVGKLKMQTPTSANVQISYPLRFAPNN